MVRLDHTNATNGTRYDVWSAARDQHVGHPTVLFTTGLLKRGVLDYWARELILKNAFKPNHPFAFATGTLSINRPSGGRHARMNYVSK